jgi:hypothetical protein
MQPTPPPPSASPFDKALWRYRSTEASIKRALKLEAQGRDSLSAESWGGLCRKHFAAMADLLDHHRAGTGELPKDLAGTLAKLIGYIGRGILPEPIRDATAGQGNKPIGPTEESDIRCGCVYIAAVKALLIGDRRPVRTVAEAYEVDERSVMRWVCRYPVADADMRADPENIVRRMKVAGAAYSRHGRSTAAVKARNAKV